MLQQHNDDYTIQNPALITWLGIWYDYTQYRVQEALDKHNDKLNYRANWGG